MSVSVTMTITAGPGKLGELKERLIANLRATRAFAGNELISLVEPREQDGVLLLLEQWRTLDDFLAYKSWRSESGTSVLAGDLVASPPVVVFSDILF